ncbi:Protein SET DOMAIN GROUP 40 [Acorus calamus]|uniref:Protein SET DOMAIN GROUP 40 n=1 Tax=Acorus calamus TaxID=4465 RepID=A0AAV9FCH5_ACOCL|nr:Protein SET DOMAIN GROUP 40 [Acorus calamus]
MEEQEKWEEFLRWASEIGVSDSASHSSSSSCLGRTLVVAHFPNQGGRGLGAAREIAKGELVLRVPREALMTTESLLLRDEKLRIALGRRPRLSSTQELTICLLVGVGKGKDSWWYPYLLQLPRTYDTLASFKQFESQALQVDDAIWASEKAISKVRADWKDVVLIMQEIGLKPQLRSFKAWLWASATISTRTLHVPWDNAGCLCPIGDLFNYAAPEESCTDNEDLSEASISSSQMLNSERHDEKFQRLTDGGYEEDVNAYCFYARKRYKKGEQVLLSYGTYTNLELLEHYGFLLDLNPNDKAYVPIDSRVLSSTSFSRESIYIQHDGRPSFALSSVLRLGCAPQNSWKAIGHLVYTGAQLSVDNEVSAMKWLAKTCLQVLRKMPTTIENDKLLLRFIGEMQTFMPPVCCFKGQTCEREINDFFQADGVCDGIRDISLPMKAKRILERWRLAVQWRFMYKKMLADCIVYCDELISGLSISNVSGNNGKC